MARTSQGRSLVLALLTLSPLLGTGCIIAEAPDYGEPPATPIFLSDPNPSPSDLQILSSDIIPPMAFKVTAHSEDAGVPVVTAMYVDYKHGLPANTLLEKHQLPAMTIDTPRPITYYVSADSLHFQDVVCHSLTLMVMHVTSWNDAAQVPNGSPPDLALMTWFVSVDDTGTTLLSSCPTLATVTP